MTCTPWPIRDVEYLLRAIARSREDYYTGSGESPGHWAGGGAEVLSLAGEVDPDQFRRVLAGRDPETGEQLVRRKVAGFDLAFSPPKSISVLWGLGGADVAKVVQDAHDEAVAAALGYMESQAASVGVRVGGRAGTHEVRRAEGFVGAVFRHRTSRAGDPQDWSEARAGGAEVLMLARRRRRVEELAVAAREARRSAGELGAEEVRVEIEPEATKRKSDRTWQPAERAYAVGDEILFRRNTTQKWKHLRESMGGVFNGAAGTVTRVDPETGTITVRLAAATEDARAWEAARAKQEDDLAEAATTPDERATAKRRAHDAKARAHRRLEDWKAGIVNVGGRRVVRPGGEVTVDAEYLAAGHVAYSYARSIHSAQGATADITLVDGSDLRGREAAYVAMSRHRQDVRIYLTEQGAPLDTERHVEAPGRKHDEPVADLIERISGSEQQRTATEQTTRAAIDRRQAIRELAERPAEELAAERKRFEAELAQEPAVKPPSLAQAEQDYEAAEAAAQSGSSEARRQAWLIGQRLQAERERAARMAVRQVDRAPDARSARLADLRAAEREQQRRRQEMEVHTAR